MAPSLCEASLLVWLSAAAPSSKESGFCPEKYSQADHAQKAQKITASSDTTTVPWPCELLVRLESAAVSLSLSCAAVCTDVSLGSLALFLGIFCSDPFVVLTEECHEDHDDASA